MHMIYVNTILYLTFKPEHTIHLVKSDNLLFELPKKKCSAPPVFGLPYGEEEGVGVHKHTLSILRTSYLYTRGVIQVL